MKTFGSRGKVTSVGSPLEFMGTSPDILAVSHNDPSYYIIQLIQIFKNDKAAMVSSLLTLSTYIRLD